MPYTLHPEGDAGSAITLHHVTSDSFTRDQEVEVMRIIGRGKKVNKGTDYGRIRDLAITLWENGVETVDTQLSNITDLMAPGCDAIVLTDSFGDAMTCSIVSLEGSRVAAGTDDYMQVTMTLEEVT